MRQNNLKIQIALRFPFEHPDANGVVYSKQAVEQAVSGLYENLPILYRGNDKDRHAEVIGHTVGESASVLWDDEHQICEVIINGNVYYGGTECIVNKVKNGIVTDFDIVSVGISE